MQQTASLVRISFIPFLFTKMIYLFFLLGILSSYGTNRPGTINIIIQFIRSSF
jgi:hypothetical protein